MVGKRGKLGHELTVHRPPRLDTPLTGEGVGVNAFHFGPLAVGTRLGPLLSHRPAVKCECALTPIIWLNETEHKDDG